MPEMPSGNPWPNIDQVKIAEQEIRGGNIDYTAPTDLAPYWKDIIELFRIHKMFEDMRTRGDDLTAERPELRRIVKTMKEISPIYEIYIRDKLQRKKSPVRDLFENAG
jgi:thymidylate synthase